MKNYIAVAIAALGLIIAAAILGSAVKNRNRSDNTVAVTGLGSKTFTSDLITWSGSFSKNNTDLKSAYDALAVDRKVIFDYLKSKGVKENEMIFFCGGYPKTVQEFYRLQWDLSARRILRL